MTEENGGARELLVHEQRTGIDVCSVLGWGKRDDDFFERELMEVCVGGSSQTRTFFYYLEMGAVNSVVILCQ